MALGNGAGGWWSDCQANQTLLVDGSGRGEKVRSDVAFSDPPVD